MTTLKIAPPLKSFEDVAAVAQGSIEEFVKTAQEQAQKQIDESVAAAKTQAEKLQEQLAKSYEEFAALSKGNVEAVVASSAVVVKGAEDFSKAYATLTKTFFEKYVAAGKAVLAAKSVDEVVAVSNDFAKTSYESLVAEAGKLQELSVQVANEALAPLSARFTIAVEKLAKPLAA